jgi:hypothetical protein
MEIDREAPMDPPARSTVFRPRGAGVVGDTGPDTNWTGSY